MQTTKYRRSRSGGGFGRNRNYSSSKPRRGRFHGGHSRSGKDRTSGRGSGRKLPTFDPSQFINTNPVELKPEVYTPKHTFADFKLDGRLTRTIASTGLSTPTPIQDQLIPHILDDRDVIGLAETGTGKTAAFLIPLIEKTLKNHDHQTIVLAPTRELALQIDAELRKLATGNRIFSTICVGGTGMGPQIKSLRRKNHFIIGTPGRVLDLINRGNLRTNRIATVVLDEADRMLDMGFIHDMRKILATVPDKRETLLISATMNKECEAIVNDFLTDPVTVSVKKRDVTGSIEQDVIRFHSADKFQTLHDLLAGDDFKRVLIFGSMKHSVEKLAKELTRSGVVAESIHGNKTHGQRQKSLAKFKSGNARVLVATDVAARGIHVDNVSHVINYDMPQTFDDYVHRIGRTGRAAQRGKALTFVPA